MTSLRHCFLQAVGTILKSVFGIHSSAIQSVYGCGKRLIRVLDKATDVDIPGRMSMPLSNKAGSVFCSWTTTRHPRDPRTGENGVNVLSVVSAWSPVRKDAFQVWPVNVVFVRKQLASHSKFRMAKVRGCPGFWCSEFNFEETQTRNIVLLSVKLRIHEWGDKQTTRTFCIFPPSPVPWHTQPQPEKIATLPFASSALMKLTKMFTYQCRDAMWVLLAAQIGCECCSAGGTCSSLSSLGLGTRWKTSLHRVLGQKYKSPEYHVNRKRMTPKNQLASLQIVLALLTTRRTQKPQYSLQQPLLGDPSKPCPEPRNRQQISLDLYLLDICKKIWVFWATHDGSLEQLCLCCLSVFPFLHHSENVPISFKSVTRYLATNTVLRWNIDGGWKGGG